MYVPIRHANAVAINQALNLKKINFNSNYSTPITINFKSNFDFKTIIIIDFEVM